MEPTKHCRRRPRRRPQASPWTPLLLVAAAMFGAALPFAARGDDAFASGSSVPRDENVKLRVQLDRTAIRAYEPVYLCLWAEQFASGDVEVQISKDGGQFTVVRLNPKAWVTAEIAAGEGRPSIRRRGIVLLSQTVDDKRSFLFAQPGKYRVVVRVGGGANAEGFNLVVTPPPPGEQPAWESLTDRVIDDILTNGFGDDPSQATVNACANVVRNYPRTVCAGYCQSYLSIARFKILYAEKKKSGGAAVYGPITDELNKVAGVFGEGFFGELTGFYAAYANGLCKDFDALLRTIGNTHTRMTLWGDALEAMQDEVMRHVGPRVISVETPPDPSTKPATAPTKP